MLKKCHNCGHSTFYVSDVIPGENGILLPGTASLWAVKSRFRLYVCDACGFSHFFVPPEHQEKVRDSKRFKRIDV